MASIQYKAKVYAGYTVKYTEIVYSTPYHPSIQFAKPLFHPQFYSACAWEIQEIHH